eukprot:900669-Rhodomonas_salina.2
MTVDDFLDDAVRQSHLRACPALTKPGWVTLGQLLRYIPSNLCQESPALTWSDLRARRGGGRGRVFEGASGATEQHRRPRPTPGSASDLRLPPSRNAGRVSLKATPNACVVSFRVVGGPRTSAMSVCMALMDRAWAMPDPDLSESGDGRAEGDFRDEHRRDVADGARDHANARQRSGRAGRTAPGRKRYLRTSP